MAGNIGFTRKNQGSSEHIGYSHELHIDRQLELPSNEVRFQL